MSEVLMSLLNMLLVSLDWSEATPAPGTSPSTDVRLGWDPNG